MITYLKSLPAYKKLQQEERLTTYLDEKVIQDVLTKESGDPLVQLMSLPNSTILSISDTIPTLLVRKTFGERLIRAGQLLAQQGARLVINETYRDLRKQRATFNEVYAELQQNFPKLSKARLWEKVTQFIADPDLTPPHCTGGAADVYLANAATGQLLDMGAPINTLGETAALMCQEISLEGRQNRELLLQAMLDAGCAPLPTEWWHFSYGEKYWAAFYDTKAVYDVILPDGSIDSLASVQ